MNDFIGKVSGCIERNRLLPHVSKVIVALSGGADSVALLVVLHESGYDCIAAHCDFHLRGEESERDRRYAESVASQYASQYRETHFDVNTYKKEHGVSTEDGLPRPALRMVSQAFGRIRRNTGGNRPSSRRQYRDSPAKSSPWGTGITGLTGMKYRNGIFIRPMLDCRRKEVETFLSR